MSGPVPNDQKHIVIMELEGPKDQKAYDAFKAALELCQAPFVGNIVCPSN